MNTSQLVSHETIPLAKFVSKLEIYPIVLTIAVRELHSKIRNIEDKGECAELIARHIGVLLQTHDGGVVDQCLVEVLKAVAAEHQRHDHEVDFTEEAPFVLCGHFTGLALLAQELEGGIRIANIFDDAYFFDLAFFGECFGHGGLDVSLFGTHGIDVKLNDALESIVERQSKRSRIGADGYNSERHLCNTCFSRLNHGDQIFSVFTKELTMIDVSNLIVGKCGYHMVDR